MPPWPVSTTTMPLSGTCLVSSWQMRSGRIGTASDSIAGLYCTSQSLQIARTSDAQTSRRDALLRSACSSMRASVTLASPLMQACSG